MKSKIIINPAAGKGLGRLYLPKIQENLREYALDFSLAQTNRPWHAADLAKQAVSEGYDAVIAAGGDGTANEVLNGIMQARQAGLGSAKLGVICIGRGNDFAYGAGMPLTWQDGCKALLHGGSRWVDIGKICSDGLAAERYFGNGVGIGFDAVVNIQASRIKLRGFLNYLVSVLSTILLYYHSPLMKIECDHTTLTQACIMVSIMNGRRMGGGFLMAPDSSSTDGQFDLCIARKVSRLTILSMVPRFMKGNQASHPAIRFERSSHVKVTGLNSSLPVHADGETLCTGCHWLEIETLPHQIEVITNLA